VLIEERAWAFNRFRPFLFLADRQDNAMNDPLDKATSRAPATLGEGCLSRYDPDALDAEDGTDFPDAAQLWKQLQALDEAPAAPEEDA
jgi:hypothetical protein